MADKDLAEALSTAAGAATCAAIWAAKAASTKDPKEAKEWAMASINASLVAEALAQKEDSGEGGR